MHQFQPQLHGMTGQQMPAHMNQQLPHGGHTAPVPQQQHYHHGASMATPHVHGQHQMTPPAHPHQHGHQHQHGPQQHNLKKQLFDSCKSHQHYLVQFQTTDGQMVEGIIDGVDDDYVSLLVPEGEMEYREGSEEQNERFGLGGLGALAGLGVLGGLAAGTGFGGYPGYGYPGYGYPGYGYPGYGPFPGAGLGYGYPRRFRRFRRRRFPLHGFTGMMYPPFY